MTGPGVVPDRRRRRISLLLILPALLLGGAAGFADPPGPVGPGGPAAPAGTVTTAGPVAAGMLSWFRSNDAGMLLERISAWRRDEFDWIASVQEAGQLVVRRLFEKGKEVRRWESVVIDDGTRREEREIAGGELEARRVYDTEGNLALEESFRAGSPRERTAFEWSSGRLLRARTTGPDGGLLRTDEYLYRKNGSLREVRRNTPSGMTGAARFFWGSAGIAQERGIAGTAQFITRYDPAGRVSSRELREGNALVSREDFILRPGSGALLSSTENIPGQGRVVRRQYDESGRLVQETVQGPAGASERTELTRDGEGRVTLKKRQGPEGLEEWRYSYDADGDLSTEQYARRGALEKVTTYLGGSRRVEELYAQGEVFLRMSWEGGRRVKEEVLEAGQVVRERVFE